MRSCGGKQVLGCRCARVRKDAMATAGLLVAPPRQFQQLPASLQNRVVPDITGWCPCLARRRVGSRNVLARHSDARRVDAAPRGSSDPPNPFTLVAALGMQGCEVLLACRAIPSLSRFAGARTLQIRPSHRADYRAATSSRPALRRRLPTPPMLQRGAIVS